jgi:hypothetical protein
VASSLDDSRVVARVAPTAPVVNVRFSRRMLAWLLVLIFGPWLVVAALLAGPKLWAGTQSLLPFRVRAVSAQKSKGQSGPWGELKYARLNLDLPDEFVFVLPGDCPPIRWFFKGYSKEQALEFLKSADLTAAQRDVLKSAAWSTTAEGVAVSPGDALILGLSPAARAKIYALLVEFPENCQWIDPVWIQPELLEERLKDSKLSAASVALLKRLLYQQAGSPLLLFADFEPALRQLPDESEQRRFMKAVSRKSTLLATLKIEPGADVESLANYWGIGGRHRDLVPLLSSLRRVDGGCNINVVCLLPPFLRDHLYTYPLPPVNAAAVKQDCFWSAMNAFNQTPDDRFNDMQYVHKVLDTEYYNILEPSQLGDLIFLATKSNEAIHAAVYVADDIVFTKNGAVYTQPWLLMRQRDMIETYAVRYPSSGPLQVLYFRKKAL